LIANEIKPKKIVEINIHDKLNSNFPVLDVFVQVAAHIARGGKLEVIGKQTTKIKSLKNLEPLVTKDNSQILGNVIYIDNYGNVISNISKKFFENVGKGRQFTIYARGFELNNIYDNYSDAINFDRPRDKREEDGKELAIFNTSDYLELAIYKSNPETVGSASSLLGLKIMDTVKINFE